MTPKSKIIADAAASSAASAASVASYAASAEAEGNREKVGFELPITKQRIGSALIWAGAIALIVYFSGGAGITLYDNLIGSSMKHSAPSPFKVEKLTYAPGEVVHYKFVRHTDFNGIMMVTWELFQTADTDGDGIEEVERFGSGANERIIRKGTFENASSLKLPDVLPDGKYYFAFAAKVQYRSYSRIETSYTAPFWVKNPKP